MKKLFLSIFLFTFYAIIFLVNPGFGYGLTTISSYEDYYNDYGKLIKRISNDYTEQWLYNASNNPVIRLESYYSNDGSNSFFLFKYKYRNNKLIQEYFLYVNSNKYIEREARLTDYVYDEGGKLIKKIQNLIGKQEDILILDQVFEYFYDYRGYLIREDWYVGERLTLENHNLPIGQLIKWATTNYEYNADGQLMRERKEREIERTRDAIEYSYFKGKLAKEIYRNYFNEVVLVIEYYYDKNDKLIKKTIGDFFICEYKPYYDNN